MADPDWQGSGCWIHETTYDACAQCAEQDHKIVVEGLEEQIKRLTFERDNLRKQVDEKWTQAFIESLGTVGAQKLANLQIENTELKARVRELEEKLGIPSPPEPPQWR